MESPLSIPGERFRIYSVEELLAAPPPEWLIDGLFETESQVVLYGAPGSAKSFIALDWALSIASGRPWLGRTVRQGPILYIAAEGGKGIAKRVQAWQQFHGIDQVPGAGLIVEPVQLFHPPPSTVGAYGREIRGRDEIEDLTKTLDARNIRPALIVFDTFARAFVGGDENSAKDVGVAIARMDRLRQRYGAAVVVVHHSTKSDKGIERGTSALRGAADVMISVEKKSRRIVLVNNKQKEHEEFDDIEVQLEEVVLANEGEEPTTSAVIVAPSSQGGGGVIDPLSSAIPTIRGTAMLATLLQFPARTAKLEEWLSATPAAPSPSTFRRDLKELEQLGLVESPSRGMYRATARNVISVNDTSLKHHDVAA